MSLLNCSSTETRNTWSVRPNRSYHKNLIIDPKGSDNSVRALTKLKAKVFLNPLWKQCKLFKKNIILDFNLERPDLDWLRLIYIKKENEENQLGKTVLEEKPSGIYLIILDECSMIVLKEKTNYKTQRSLNLYNIIYFLVKLPLKFLYSLILINAWSEVKTWHA